MDVDYIIVGGGLAGLCFAEICLQNNKSFVIFEDNSRTSSKVAGGMFNPVVLKRFTSIWEADNQITFANKFYPIIEAKLNKRFYFPLPILRKFASYEEQNNWFIACDNPITAPYLNTQLYKDKFESIPNTYHFGEVYKCGYLDVYSFVTSFHHFLDDLVFLRKDRFLYNDLVCSDTCIFYQDIIAKHIVFSEGFSIHQNPYFNFLPVDGTKGELLYVKIPNLNLDKIIKSSVFIIPLGNDIYKVGATYNWQDKSDIPTQAGLVEIIEGLESLINCPYEIIEHIAGVRPTVKDRRPLVGSHFKLRNLYVLNGLGTRGVLLAPYLADRLFQHIENNQPLDHNISVHRYYKKLQLIK